jgi:Ca2+-binding EF-hand superfamily protein
MMGGRVMGRGMMGGGQMEHPMILRIIFAIVDTDGNGTIELQEFQAAHERIFKAMDTNKDGHLTPEEMEAFIHGAH